MCPEVRTISSLRSHSPFPPWERRAQEGEATRSRAVGIRGVATLYLPLCHAACPRGCILPLSPSLPSPQPHWEELGFSGLHSAALWGTPDFTLSPSEHRLHSCSVPALQKRGALPGPAPGVSEWKHEASGGVVVGLHAARGGVLCGPISSPTVWALPFILQGTGRLRQGAKGSHHSREGGRKRGSRLSQGRPPPSGPWATGQGCAGGRGREDREERERGRENPDMGARPAMAGGEKARAWRAVVLGAGPSVRSKPSAAHCRGLEIAARR